MRCREVVGDGACRAGSSRGREACGDLVPWAEQSRARSMCYAAHGQRLAAAMAGERVRVVTQSWMLRCEYSLDSELKLL